MSACSRIPPRPSPGLNRCREVAAENRATSSARVVRLEHVGIWTHDLESMRRFYAGVLGGVCGPLYENAQTGFRSYFVSLGEGARIELMTQPGVLPRQGPAHGQSDTGYAHIALELPDRQSVREAVAGLADAGAAMASAPRTTGDGYYEAVILDPDGNRVELLAAMHPGR